jgi:hypothetical protein
VPSHDGVFAVPVGALDAPMQDCRQGVEVLELVALA